MRYQRVNNLFLTLLRFVLVSLSCWVLGYGYRVLKDPVCPLLSICPSKSDGKVDVKGDSTFYDNH